MVHRGFGAVVLRCVGLAAMAIALIGQRPAHARPTAATSITSFYATSKAEWDKRNANAGYVAIKHTALPSGSKYLAFYFSWDGAGKSSGYFVVLRHPGGATIDVDGFFKFGVQRGSAAVWFANSGAPWPDGAYDADLIVDDKLAATAHISVGGAGAAPASAATILQFYPTTQAEVNRWYKQSGFYPLPAKVGGYPAGTATVILFFHYTHAVPKVTTEESIIRGPAGLKITRGPFALTDVNGGTWSDIAAPQHLAYPNGAYAAVLLLDGAQAAKATFTIG